MLGRAYVYWWWFYFRWYQVSLNWNNTFMGFQIYGQHIFLEVHNSYRKLLFRWVDPPEKPQKLEPFTKIKPFTVFYALVKRWMWCAYLRIQFLCPRHKMARGHLVFALSVIIPSFHHSIPSKFVFSTPPTSLHGFEWNLVNMLYHKSRSACGEIIYVRQILAEVWPLTPRIFTHFSLSSQLLHPCMDLNETWQGCCTTILEVHVGRLFMFDKFWQSYGSWHLGFSYILACLLNFFILAWILMKLGNGGLHHKSRFACG